MVGYNKFKQFLVEQGITQQEIAELLEMSRSHLNLILNGQRGKDFKLSEVLTICTKYGISPDVYFISEK